LIPKQSIVKKSETNSEDTSRLGDLAKAAAQKQTANIGKPEGKPNPNLNQKRD
jgi:hypothetical protein